MRLKTGMLSFALLLFATSAFLRAQEAVEPSAEPLPSQLAHYLVLEAESDLPMLVSHYQQVRMQGGLESLGDAELTSLETRLDGRQHRAATVRLRDDLSGRIVFQSVVRIPRWMRSETLLPAGDPRSKQRGSRIDGHLEPLYGATFVVRVPVIEGATTLEVGYGPRSLESTDVLDLEDLARRFGGTGHDTKAIATTEAIAGATFEAVPGHTAGSASNRLDVLFVGEGYRSSDLYWFRFDTDGLTDGFLSESPFTEYSNYLNFWRLHVPSNQSGADRPQCNDPDANGQDTGAMVDTAFDATYCSSGIWRLLTVDTAAVLQAAVSYPDWDVIVVLVQSPIRGGSGGEVPVTALDTNYAISDDVVGVMLHELGHSFGDLGDEYVDAAAAAIYDPCSDASGSGLIPCEANVTDLTSRSQVKWTRWISSTTPVPTTSALSDPLGAGLWEGSRYLMNDMYRQCFSGKMRNTLSPFCRVDREALLLKLYEGGWGSPTAGIYTIEPGTRSPASSSVSVGAGNTVTLKAKVLGPAGGSNLTVEWYLNGFKVSTQSAASGSNPSYSFLEYQGGTTWTMTMKVKDNSSFIHSTQRNITLSQTSWTIHVTGGCGTC